MAASAVALRHRLRYLSVTVAPELDPVERSSFDLPAGAWMSHESVEGWMDVSAVCLSSAVTAMSWHIQGPVGLVVVSHGSTSVEAWSPSEALTACGKPSGSQSMSVSCHATASLDPLLNVNGIFGFSVLMRCTC